MRCEYPTCLNCPKAGIQTNRAVRNFDHFTDCANQLLSVPADIEREAREHLKARTRKRR